MAARGKVSRLNHAEMKDAFADIIRAVEVASISREHKFVYF